MFEYRDGRLYFVLIDFDMATVLPTGEDASYVPTSKHRTGTLPFMAVDLIKDASLSGKEGHVPIAHRLCHDFESIFWLCLWCTMVMLHGLEEAQRNENLAIVRAWETSELKSIAFAKKCIRSEALAENQFTMPPAAMEAGLEEWFEAWTAIWHDVGDILGRHGMDVAKSKRRKLSPPSFDFETVGGMLTRDRMKAVLMEAFPDDHAQTPLEGVLEVEGSADTDSAPVTHPETARKDDPIVKDIVKDIDGTDKDVAASRKTDRVTKKAPKAAAASTKRKSHRAVKKSSGVTKANVVKKAVEATAKKAKVEARASVKEGKTREVVRKVDAALLATAPQNAGDENDIRKRLRPRKRV